MKKKNLFWGLLALLTLPTTFIACDDDDDDFVYYTDMATVKDMNGQWILLGDECGELVPDNTALLKANDADKDGQRIIAAFDYDDKENRNNKKIELYDIYRVLTKDFYQLPENDEHKADSIGNDPIAISRILTSPEHINIQFVINGDNSNIKHFINLISVGENPEPDASGVLKVELRHNNEGDHPRMRQWGWAAFTLKSIPGYTEGKTKKLSIKVYEGNGTEKTILYDLKEDKNENKKLDRQTKEDAISNLSSTKAK